LTLIEFLSWDPGDSSGRGWQLIDGEPLAMAPGSETHGAIQSELIGLLRNHLIERQSPCRVIAKPGIVPRVRAGSELPYPGSRCDLRQAIPRPDGVGAGAAGGSPFPSNEADTRANVWAYTTIPSVRELLVVNSTRIETELLRRDPDGAWSEQPELIGPDGTLTLASIELTIRLTALYRTTALLPPAA
jgi:Uma2 family endonuclease